MTDFPGIDLLYYWIGERESVDKHRAAGEPRPWSEDRIFQKETFCQVERERDRVSVWIRQHWREPYRNHPDGFLMAVARLINEPKVLDKITPPLPWDKDRFLAEMAAKGLKVGVRGYRTVIGRGIPTHENLARNVFDPLWAARERIRPRVGDTLRAVFNRLSTFHGLGGTGFLAGQIVADTKFTPPLESASDWWDFVTPGPGSKRGLNIVCGRDPEAPWSDDRWHSTFVQLRAVADPRIEEILGRRLSASDTQSALCELSKYHRAKTTGRIARPFTPYGEAPARRKTPAHDPATTPLNKQNGAPAPTPIETPVTAPVAQRHNIFRNLARRFIVPATSKPDGLRLVFDAEADNLLDTATKVHCIVVADLDGEQVAEYGPDQIPAALERLAHADVLVGHNLIGYDLPLFERLHGWRPKAGCTIVDTLITSRLILPHIADLDDQAAAMGDPPLGKLRGRYSLEAWGDRLGIPKIGTDVDFSEWSPKLQQRCADDTALTRELHHFLQVDGYSRQAMELEHRVAAICDRITTDGIPFDREAAERLCEQWETRRDVLKAQLQQRFPGMKKVSSRVQLGNMLEARGWMPQKRTEKKCDPVIDDELLETIAEKYPDLAEFAELHLLIRRLGQLATGHQAWLNNVGADERLHGRLIPIGTPHSRAKHLQPNIAQVPNPKRGKPFARECRALFRADGWVFVTCDQSNLQDRAVGHYLHEFDDGAYAKAFLDSVDMHWQSAIALGLIPAGTERDKSNAIHTAIRERVEVFPLWFFVRCRRQTRRRDYRRNRAQRAPAQFDERFVSPALRRRRGATEVQRSAWKLIRGVIRARAQASRIGRA
jgi:hypothetical protein